MYVVGNNTVVFASIFVFEPAMSTDASGSIRAVEWYVRGICEVPKLALLHRLSYGASWS